MSLNYLLECILKQIRFFFESGKTVTFPIPSMSQDWIYASEGDGDWELCLKPEEKNIAAKHESDVDTEEVEDNVSMSPTDEMSSITTQLKKNNREVEELREKVCYIEDQIEGLKREFGIKLAHRRNASSSDALEEQDLPKALANASLGQNGQSEKPTSSWKRWPRGLLGAIIGFTTVGVFTSVVMLISTVHLLTKCCSSITFPLHG